MWLKKHKSRGVDRYSMLLVMLGFFFAVAWAFSTDLQSNGSFFAYSSNCTTASSSDHPEQAKVSVIHARQKISHHRIRHKQIKSFLKRTKENSASSVLLCWNIVHNFLPRSDTLIKPGYYLFLFRLMLF
jgi:hypothetical protein